MGRELGRYTKREWDGMVRGKGEEVGWEERLYVGRSEMDGKWKVEKMDLEGRGDMAEGTPQQHHLSALVFLFLLLCPAGSSLADILFLLPLLLQLLLPLLSPPTAAPTQPPPPTPATLPPVIRPPPFFQPPPYRPVYKPVAPLFGKQICVGIFCKRQSLWFILPFGRF